MYLYPLTNKLGENNFGGKAAGLSNICAQGLKVPKGFALIKKAKIDFEVDKETIVQELATSILELSGSELIVRSSAIGEDSEDFSFAGQLDSFVVKNNIEAVIDGVEKCWLSMQSDRVKAYQEISGNALTEMGVVVQEFVEAEYSGVLFTQSPYNSDHTYVEYVKGGAEPLVSGKVTPLVFSVNHSNKLVQKTTLPFDYKDLLSKVAVLKKHFNKHLDIEWIYRNQEFYFVQARPIKQVKKDIVYWTNTNLNENYPNAISPLLYSIARDSYYNYFKNLAKLLQLDKDAIRNLEYDLNNTVGVWGNRIYYNMTSIHNIMSASPYRQYLKGAFDNFVGYLGSDATSKHNMKQPSHFRQFFRLAYLNLKLNSHAKKTEVNVQKYTDKAKQSHGLRQLSDGFNGFLDLRFYQWYHASLADFFSMIHYKLLGNYTKRFYGSEGVGIHNILIQAIPGLITHKPLQASWNILQEIQNIPNGKELFLATESKEIYSVINNDKTWNKVKLRVDDYLELWGFRCSGELEFNTENYIEAPWKFMDLLKSYIQCGQEDPSITIQRMNEERKVHKRKLSKKIFAKRHVLFPLAIIEVLTLNTLASLCRKAIYQRERVRYRQAQMYYVFKTYVLKLGAYYTRKGIFENEKDILFLHYKEIGSLIGSADMFAFSYKELIKVRKADYHENSSKSFPGTFETEFGEQPKTIVSNQEDIKGRKEFKGLPASGGLIRGKVKVLESVFEADKIEPGEILVTKQTDPGWAMLFPIIGGLIVERGGALSHGAIVAREFGIPAVVGIEGITDVLKDNDEVILDGESGQIKLI